jgi:beta-carotene hydroxylase
MSAETASIRPPRLSELGVDLLHLTKFQLLRALATPFIAFAAYWLLAGSGHWPLAVLSLIILSFVTYGSTSHDLVHRSLGLNPFLNDFLLSITELIALRSGHAYRAAHLNHHARFPRDDDIEGEAARMSFLRALCEGVVFQFRIYGWALRNPHGSPGWIAGEGVAVLVLLAAAVTAIPFTIVPAVYAALMIAGSWIIPLITSYLPHDARAPGALHQTRLFRGSVARILAFDHLYHLEHHLYPAVPHQNWARLARRLDPWLRAAGIHPVRIVF